MTYLRFYFCSSVQYIHTYIPVYIYNWFSYNITYSLRKKFALLVLIVNNKTTKTNIIKF